MVSYASDLPVLEAWGERYQLGPGTIRVAHTNHEQAATLLDMAITRALISVSSLASSDRLEARYRKWRAMGNVALVEG